VARKQLISKHYASAFIAYALNAEMDVEKTYFELRDLDKKIKQSHRLKILFTNSGVPTTVRVKAWKQIAKTLDLSEASYRLVSLLMQNNRVGIIKTLYENIERLWLKQKNMTKVDIIIAHEIKSDFKHKVIEMLNKILPFKPKLNFHVDPGIHGGLIIKWHSMIIDSSIKGKCQRLIKYCLE
jgi:ATP synthase F1 delta subunit